MKGNIPREGRGEQNRPHDASENRSMLDPNKLRAMIQKRGLTQKEVARRVRKRGGKLSPVKLNHLCHVAKPSDPKLSIIEGIAAVLQCSMMKLLSRKVEIASTSRTIVDHIGDVVADVMMKEALDHDIAAPAEVVHVDAPPVVVETPRRHRIAIGRHRAACRRHRCADHRRATSGHRTAAGRRDHNGTRGGGNATGTSKYERQQSLSWPAI
jgi:transcriptional regulator with XRE-family HTH domain